MYKASETERPAVDRTHPINLQPVPGKGADVPYQHANPKTEGKWVHIACGSTAICPVVNLQKFLQAACVKDNEFIFRGIVKTKYKEKLQKKNNPLSYGRAREIIMKTVAAIGLDKSNFATHSLCSGGATQAANCGVPDRLFKRHGRWRSETAKDMYIQDDIQELLSVTQAMCL